MNPNEAREIVSGYEGWDEKSADFSAFRAKGFLEGHAYAMKQVEPLIKALEKIMGSVALGGCLASEDESKCSKHIAMKALSAFHELNAPKLATEGKPNKGTLYIDPNAGQLYINPDLK